MPDVKISEVFDDFASWANVKPGDRVTIVVNGKAVNEGMIYEEGSAIGRLKKRTLDRLKEEGQRQLAQKG